MLRSVLQHGIIPELDAIVKEALELVGMLELQIKIDRLHYH